MIKSSRETEYFEINLANYCKLLLRSKQIVIGAFVLFLAFSLSLTLISPKVYKVSTLLEVGVLGDSFIEDPEVLPRKISSNVFVPTRYKVRSYATGGPLVELEIETANTEEAVELLAVINNKIIQDHDNKLIIEKALLTEHLAKGERELSFLKTRKEYNEGIYELQSTIFGLNNRLAKLEPTKVVKEAVVSEYPISPRLLPNLVLAGLIGLLVGIFAVFFREWWRKNMKE